ncbi:MAG: hypothetical protein Q4B95_07550 [Lonepinella koalarum]|nr:hypothetical protein [Lonepinella koalarum]
MIDYLSEIENKINFKLPKTYSNFLLSMGSNVYEITDTSITLYPLCNLLEINNSYKVQEFDPSAFLIAQDGDLGFYIRKESDEMIFELGLGSLGSLNMRPKGTNIYDFMEKIREDYIDDE